MNGNIDRRIVKSKEAIFAAFIALISEKDFESITINEIAERANVNRGTIYFHYQDKYDLLNQCIEESLNDLIASTTTTDADGATIDLIQSSFLPVILYFQTHHQVYVSLLSNKGITAFRDRMLQLVVQHINLHIQMDGENSHYDRTFITQFMAHAFVGVIEWWIINDMPQPPEQIAEQLWHILHRNQIIQ